MLEDLLAPKLRVVFCGTAAGARSAALGQYYAGRGNRFWDILAATGLTPRLLVPSEHHLLPTFRIGLTDIAKHQSGNDVDIDFRPADAAALRAKILRYQPRLLCFNGKRAAREFLGRHTVDYGSHDEAVGVTSLFVAPSTSGAARASWDASIWHDLARQARRLDGGGAGVPPSW